MDITGTMPNVATEGIVSNNVAKFINEYYCSWGNDYDKPIHMIEKDNCKILQYELIGLNESHIKVEKQFINKTKEMHIVVTGKYEDEYTGWKNDINIKLRVDYNIYNGVTWNICDGILTIILQEIINPEPYMSIINKTW